LGVTPACALAEEIKASSGMHRRLTPVFKVML
jgi:hypothetical protein